MSSKIECYAPTEAISPEEKIAQIFVDSLYSKKIIDEIADRIAKEILSTLENWISEGVPLEFYEHVIEPYSGAQSLDCKFLTYSYILNLESASKLSLHRCRRESCLSMHERIGEVAQKILNEKAPKNLTVALSTERRQEGDGLSRSIVSSYLFFEATAQLTTTPSNQSGKEIEQVQ